MKKIKSKGSNVTSAVQLNCSYLNYRCNTIIEKLLIGLLTFNLFSVTFHWRHFADTDIDNQITKLLWRISADSEMFCPRKWQFEKRSSIVVWKICRTGHSWYRIISTKNLYSLCKFHSKHDFTLMFSYMLCFFPFSIILTLGKLKFWNYLKLRLKM